VIIYSDLLLAMSFNRCSPGDCAFSWALAANLPRGSIGACWPLIQADGWDILNPPPITMSCLLDKASF